MVRRIVYVVSERWRRIGLFFLAFALAMIAVSYAALVDDEPVMPWAWPVLFGAAAISVALFAVWPSHRLLFRVSGGLTMVAFASRPIGVMARWSAGDIVGWRSVAAFVIFALLALFSWRFWIRDVAPWQVRHEAGTTAKGD